jgi:hypothetical protein
MKLKLCVNPQKELYRIVVLTEITLPSIGSELHFTFCISIFEGKIRNFIRFPSFGARMARAPGRGTGFRSALALGVSCGVCSY